MKKILNIKTLLLIAILLSPSMYAFAGIDDIGGDVDVPIDGGLSLLVAAGVGYGAKKLRKKKA
jgi:hypothetical protein